MPEVTDTSRPVTTTPEGEYVFTVSEYPLKKATKSGKGVYFLFKFSYILNGQPKTHTQPMMPWDLPPLLKAFGFKEVADDKYEWDRQECQGKRIKAKIVHEPDSKDPTKTRTRMVEISEEVPF